MVPRCFPPHGGGLLAKSSLTLATPWTIACQAPLCPWDSPGKHTEVGCHFLLQGIFPTQGWNSCLLHWQADSLSLSHQGGPTSDMQMIAESEEEIKTS